MEFADRVAIARLTTGPKGVIFYFSMDKLIETGQQGANHAGCEDPKQRPYQFAPLYCHNATTAESSIATVGRQVSGLDLREVLQKKKESKSLELIRELELEMAEHGLLVFRFFLQEPFSHVLYYIVKAPPTKAGRGGTHFCSTWKAYESLTPAEQAEWKKLYSINSSSGVVHPVVAEHPLSKKKHVFLHLGWTGAVLNAETKRLLTKPELSQMMNRYNELLSDCGYQHVYEPGDAVLIDNLSVAHRADPSAHEKVNAGQSLTAADSTQTRAEENFLRILHRVTIQGYPGVLHPPAETGLPPQLNIAGRNPFNADGVWIHADTGFEWDAGKRLQN
eukprot:g8809.t1